LELFEEEMPGILAWLVKGCLEWQQQGLKTPDDVLAATKRYRDEMDVIGTFIDTTCSLNENASATVKELYESYTDWCEVEGEKNISKKLFGMKLGERGFDNYRASRGVRTWIGIGINPESQEGINGGDV